MDRELSSSFVRKQKIKRVIGIVSTVVIGVVAIMAFRAVLKGKIKQTEIRTATADQGRVDASLTASGVVVPAFEAGITSPVQARIEAVLKAAGSSVKGGESILRLNVEESLSQLEDLKDQRALKQNLLKQKRIRKDRSLIDMTATRDIKQLRIRGLETQLEDEKYLKTIGGGTDDKIEQATVSLNIAQRELTQLDKQLTNQEEAYKAEVEGLRFEMTQLNRDIESLEKKIARAAISSDQDGIITWVKDEIGAVVSPGEPLAKVADLSRFKIRGSISDAYAEELQLGGPVSIRINETDLQGTIASIYPTVENGTITFMIQLKENDHELLRSNLRVDLFVITSFRENVVRIKNGPFYKGASRQKAFVVKGDQAIRRELLLGENNFDFIEVKEGLEPGEKLIISDMEKHIHLETLTITK